MLAVVKIVAAEGELSQYAMNLQMSLPIVAFSFSALMRALRDVLLEECFKDLATISHQGAQQAFFYREHVQYSRAGVLGLDRSQEDLGFPVAFLLRLLGFFLPRGSASAIVACSVTSTNC